MVLTSTPTAWGYAGSTGPRQAQEPNYPSALSWQEGYFEARLRFTDDPWAWPAFWLFSMAKTEAWPQIICPPIGQYTSEWDMMEGGLNNVDGSQPAARSTHSVLHRNTRNGSGGPWCGVEDTSASIHHVSPAVNLADWHTWGGLWTEDEVCLYLDDALIGCLPTYDTTAQPMHLIFTINFAGLCGDCPPKPAQLQMEVDWVRVWQQP
jgi:beta-glucanase (GH16 family)